MLFDLRRLFSLHRKVFGSPNNAVARLMKAFDSKKTGNDFPYGWNILRPDGLINSLKIVMRSISTLEALRTFLLFDMLVVAGFAAHHGLN